jgi:AraC-like DNA-binding protein
MLPYPSVRLVFVGGEARIYGVQTGLFKRRLKGVGRILGVRFWPGGFRPFTRQPVCTLANRCVPAADVFAGIDAPAVAMRTCKDVPVLLAYIQQYLLRHRPASDFRVYEARNAVQTVVGDRALLQVRQLVARTHSSERTLQRLFRCYVGASASWVIKRYRMFEALEQLRNRWRNSAVRVGSEPWILRSSALRQ